jgi:hypothetical protein
VPGVTSYQVHSYKAANGADIARVELTLDPRTTLHFASEKNALTISVSAAATPAPTTDAASVASAKKSLPQEPAVIAAAAKPSVPKIINYSHPVQVRGISVVRGHDGTNVEIRASGLLSPKTLTLKSPDRLVIDLVNAVPQSRPHDIPVHAGDLNMVRMARYQSDPPTTRVVLDLKAPQSFLLASTNDKLIVKLRPPAPETSTVAASSGDPESKKPETVAVAAHAPTVTADLSAIATNKKASDYVMVQPNYHLAASPKQAIQGQTASERAAEAAKILGATAPVEIALSENPPEASMKPEAIKAAMMQASQQS